MKPQINIYNQQSHFRGYGYNVNGLQYQNQINPITLQHLQLFQNNMYINQLQGQFLQYAYHTQPQPYFNNNYQRRCAGNIPNQVNVQRQGYFHQVPPKYNPNLQPPSYQSREQHSIFPLTNPPKHNFQEPGSITKENQKAPPPVEEELSQYEESLSSYLKPDFVRPSDEEMTRALKAMLIKDPKVDTPEPVPKLEIQKEVISESPKAIFETNSEVLPELAKADLHKEDDDFMSLDGDGNFKGNYSLRKRNEEEDEDIYGSATSLLSTSSSITSVCSRSKRHTMLMKLLDEMDKENGKFPSTKMTRADLMNVETMEPPKETVEKLSKNNILRDNVLTKQKETKSRVKLIELAAQEIRAQNKYVRFAENKEEIKKIQKITKIRSMRRECAVDLQSITEENKKSEDVEVDDEEALPVTLDMDFLSSMDIPDNVLKFGQKLLPPVFPDFVKPEKYIPIFVTEVSSPFKFWFHMRKDDDDLDLMSNTMEWVFFSFLTITIY